MAARIAMRAYALLLGTSACGPTASDADGEGSSSSSSTSSGTSGTSSTGTTTSGAASESTGATDGETACPDSRLDLPPACEEVLDDESPGDFAITIHNDRDVDVFLVAVETCILTRFRITSAAGEAWWDQKKCPSATCEEQLAASCLQWCDFACWAAAPIQIVPGASYELVWPALVREPTEPTRACDSSIGPCDHWRAVSVGEAFELTIAIAAELDCQAAECGCCPCESGWCEAEPADPLGDPETLVLPFVYDGPAVDVHVP